MVERRERSLADRVVAAQAFDLVAEQLDAQGQVVGGWEDVDDAAAASYGAGAVDDGLAPVAGGVQGGEELGGDETLAEAQPRRHQARGQRALGQGLHVRDDQRPFAGGERGQGAEPVGDGLGVVAPLLVGQTLPRGEGEDAGGGVWRGRAGRGRGGREPGSDLVQEGAGAFRPGRDDDDGLGRRLAERGDDGGLAGVGQAEDRAVGRRSYGWAAGGGRGRAQAGQFRREEGQEAGQQARRRLIDQRHRDAPPPRAPGPPPPNGQQGPARRPAPWRVWHPARRGERFPSSLERRRGRADQAGAL